LTTKVISSVVSANENDNSRSQESSILFKKTKKKTKKCDKGKSKHEN